MNLITALTSLVMLVQGPASDTKSVDLNDGYIRVQTPNYELEVPKGWEIGRETPWGSRAVHPPKGEGELSVMTAPPGNQSWDQLYQTSLYFIMREGPGKATPYKLVKTPRGLDAASFEVVDDKGFANRRYVLIKDQASGLIALSVKVPSREADKEWSKHFERLIKTARFLK